MINIVERIFDSWNICYYYYRF